MHIPSNTRPLDVRALCVGRHRFLSEHLCQLFGRLGVQTTAAVGLQSAVDVAATTTPDIVLCDYDLLATGSLDLWERDERLSRVPVVAVSLTRRPDEMHLLDVNGIAGFLYLPTLTAGDATRVVMAAALRSRAPAEAPPGPLSSPIGERRAHA